MLPNSIKASLLEVKHPDYLTYQDTWNIIEDIRQGATTILKKISTYLPKRPDETADLYKLRCAKAAFTPVATTAIRELITELMSIPLTVNGDDSEFWKVFKEDTDGKGLDSHELMVNIMSSLLYFGKVYVAVDRPVIASQLRSKFEEQQYKTTPQVTVYEPLFITNWGEGWFQSRQVDAITLPLEPVKHLATWCIFDNTSISKYQAEVRLDGDRLAEVKVDGTWMQVSNQNALVQMVEQVAHQLGTNPMLEASLPHEMWTGNNVYSKQLQHFIIESSWTDAGSMAGVIQRVFTPVPPVPQLDERVVYEEPDYSQLKTGNAHVLVGSDFKFQESSGDAIGNLTSQLETVERQIRAIVSMSQGSVSKEALEQSGASKAMEQKPLEKSMLAYATKGGRLYQRLLRLVARAGKQSEEVAVITPTEYGDEDLGKMLEHSNSMVMVEAKIPPTALKLWYGKLAHQMAGTTDPDIEAQIQEELEDIDFTPDEGEGMEDTPENVQKLRQTFGMTEQQAKEVLSGKAKTKRQ